MTRATATSVAAAGAVTLALTVAFMLRGASKGAPLPPVAAPESESAPMWAPPGPAPAQGTAASPATPLAAAPAAPPAPSDEAALMARLRRLRQGDAEAAIALAREGNERFPDSADAPERSSILIHALASEGQSAEARGEAESVVNRYPDSAWVREIEGFTGAHRHRNVHLEADGAIDLY